MAIYRGLNVQKAMNDVDNKAQSLVNLGLNQKDLELIRGVSATISTNELHTLAGLVVDQKKSLYSLGESAETVENLLVGLDDIQVPQEYNISYDDQVRAAAIKYNFFDFAVNQTKSADISTSRVSSWSTVGSTILYGGEIKVSGNKIQLSSLKVTSAPVAKLFRSEIPTHTVKLKINGVDQSFLAMKGIPMELQGFFRNADLSHAVTPVDDDAGQIPGTWRIVNNDNNQTYTSGDGSSSFPGNFGVGTVGSPATWPFRDSSNRSRTVQFYYDPAKILELRTTSINLTNWTTSKLPALQRLDISNNDLYVLPSFRSDSSSKSNPMTSDGLAPVLKHINMSANNLTRARDANGNQITANSQLNTLPLTLTNLTMNGVFSDSTAIDLLDYHEMQSLSMHTYYSRNASRRMSGGTISPQTVRPGQGGAASSKGIASYSIYHQPYSQLALGVCESPNLNYLYFPWCGISEKQGGGDITIASSSIGQVISYGNNHNVLDLSNKTSLTNYVHAYASGISGSSRRAIGSKFNGCSALTQLYFYSSNVTADIKTTFNSLAALSNLELRYTSVSGRLDDNSFTNTNALQHLLFAGSNINESDFFGTADSIANNSGSGEVFKNTLDLRWLYVYNNGNIRGALPDFSSNVKLTGLYLHNTGLNGPIQTFANCQNLYYLRLSSNSFTGSVPAFTGNGLQYIYMYSNQFSGQVPKFTTPYLYQLYLQYNTLSGNIPDLSGCTRLQRVYLNNNSISGFVKDSLKYSTQLSVIDFSNNQLTGPSGSDIIADLFENYSLNPRTGVSVNLLGNSTTGLTRENVINDDTEGDSSTKNKLLFLESRWTILL